MSCFLEAYYKEMTYDEFFRDSFKRITTNNDINTSTGNNLFYEGYTYIYRIKKLDPE